MPTRAAENVSLKSFLNAYFKENPFVEFKQDKYKQSYASYILKPFNFELRVNLAYYSLTGRHQFIWPAQLIYHDGQAENLHTECLIGLLMQDLITRHPNADYGHREFVQRFYNSCENVELILKYLSKEQIDTLFHNHVNFQLSELGLLSGHQVHPMPKSREGFDQWDFQLYSPEFRNEFQLHYFLADPSIVFSDTALPLDANALTRTYCAPECIDDHKTLLPMHPWQAKYIKTLPVIKKLLEQGLLREIGLLGHSFTATTSVRTVYSAQSPYMIKFSLNVNITNSLRTQYAKELKRGLAAHQFWQTDLARAFYARFPQFMVITEPAYIGLKDGDQLIHETAALFRINPFTHTSNATCLATICQDHPFKIGNRFNDLIDLVASNHVCSHTVAATLWFEQFLQVAIEPILFLYNHYGIALEAHQQNLLIELENGLPVKSYYRDNQGYYIVDSAFNQLSAEINATILEQFCCESSEFITHHFIYYLVCNSIFGVINALGTSQLISEEKLLMILMNFIRLKHTEWPDDYRLLHILLTANHLPFKGNLLTRFYQLDELTAPLTQQSVYVEIENLIKKSRTSSLKCKN